MAIKRAEPNIEAMLAVGRFSKEMNESDYSRLTAPNG
jgi:hypothetical protein